MAAYIPGQAFAANQVDLIPMVSASPVMFLPKACRAHIAAPVHPLGHPNTMVAGRHTQA